MARDQHGQRILKPAGWPRAEIGGTSSSGRPRAEESETVQVRQGELDDPALAAHTQADR